MRERRLSRKDCPRRGKKHREETKKKFSEMRKGKEPWNKGKKLSLEHRQKLSESHKDQTPWNKGKTYTFEERRRHE